MTPLGQIDLVPCGADGTAPGVKDRAFLAWAKAQGGRCCVCARIECVDGPADELHHYGPKGMAQRGSDRMVARVCLRHHAKYQGKRRIGFLRAGEAEVYAALLEDNVTLLAGYVGELQRRKP